MKTNLTKWLALTSVSLVMLLTACGKKDSGGGAPINGTFVNCAGGCNGIIGNAEQYIASAKGSAPGAMDVRFDLYGDATRMNFAYNPKALIDYVGPAAVVATVVSTGASNMYGGCNLVAGTTVLYSLNTAEMRNASIYNVRLQGVMPNNVLVTVKLDVGSLNNVGPAGTIRDTVVGGDYNLTQNRMIVNNFTIESISNMPCSGNYFLQ